MFIRPFKQHGICQKSCFKLETPLYNEILTFPILKINFWRWSLMIETTFENWVQKILKARKAISEGDPIRHLMPSNLNFKATDYMEIIHWDTCNLTPLYLLWALTNDEIGQYINRDSKPVMNFKQFPCHTQAVERCVKLVTKVSGKVCGECARDGFIRATLLSRSSIPTFSHKSKFKVIVMDKSE